MLEAREIEGLKLLTLYVFIPVAVAFIAGLEIGMLIVAFAK